MESAVTTDSRRKAQPSTRMGICNKAGPAEAKVRGNTHNSGAPPNGPPFPIGGAGGVLRFLCSACSPRAGRLLWVAQLSFRTN